MNLGPVGWPKEDWPPSQKKARVEVESVGVPTASSSVPVARAAAVGASQVAPLQAANVMEPWGVCRNPVWQTGTGTPRQWSCC